MKNKNNIPLFLGLAVAIGICIGSLLNYRGNSDVLLIRRSNQEKIYKLLRFIENDYVDEVDTDALLDSVISDIIANLDPHSAYFSKEQSLINKENMQGNFEGIGVQFFMNKDSLVVTQVLKGGASEKAGILSGDRILIADNDTLYNKNLSNNAIVKKLKGPSNTKINLTIFRKDTQEILQIPITRSKVDIQSAEVAYMLNENLGYIKLDRFSMTTFKEFKKKLKSLKEQGAENLVLDLRQNGGGFIHVARDISDEFLEGGKLIVFTENNKGKIEEFFATDKGGFLKGKIYVLIDEGTASASEIVAGSLQDNDKGTIIGRRSFGKGLVQQEMKLGDGSVVRLTTARYYTPTGRSIQKPYTLNDSKNYAKDYQKRILRGELLFKDSIEVSDSLKFITPKGKIVYGGGGIIPDIFVPIDTTYFLEIFHLNGINDYSFDYVDARRKELKKLKFDDFNSKYDKDSSAIEGYFEYIKQDKKVVSRKKGILNHYLKALIARQIFGEAAFYKVNQERDKMIEKVLELEDRE